MVKRLLIFLSIIISTFGKAQCPMVLDYLGNLLPKPYFSGFNGTLCNLNFLSNGTLGTNTIYNDYRSVTTNILLKNLVMAEIIKVQIIKQVICYC